MKRSQCDRCGTLADADPIYGSAPDSWFNVSTRNKHAYVNKDFCSSACATAFMAEFERERGDTDPSAVAPPTPAPAAVN